MLNYHVKGPFNSPFWKRRLIFFVLTTSVIYYLQKCTEYLVQFLLCAISLHCLWRKCCTYVKVCTYTGCLVFAMYCKRCTVSILFTVYCLLWPVFCLLPIAKWYSTSVRAHANTSSSFVLFFPPVQNQWRRWQNTVNGRHAVDNKHERKVELLSKEKLNYHFYKHPSKG